MTTQKKQLTIPKFKEMYKIYRVTVSQEGGDTFKKSVNKTVENKKELEAFREELRVQYGGGRVCLVYGEIEEAN